VERNVGVDPLSWTLHSLEGRSPVRDRVRGISGLFDIRSSSSTFYRVAIHKSQVPQFAHHGQRTMEYAK
jgi:hypothetical protein